MKTTNNKKRQLFSLLLFPLILFVNFLILILAIRNGWDLGSSFTNLLIGNLIGMYLLERAWKFKVEWQMNLKEFVRDFAYFGINGLIDAAVKLGLGYLVIVYTSPKIDWPLWIQSLFAILIVEFFGYWYHRLGHVNHFLWKIHSIHHIPEKVNLFNNNTANFLNILFGGIIKLFPLMIIGFSQEAAFIAISLTTIHSYVVHVNADIRGGLLGEIFFTPEHHRLHHSKDPHEAQNFAVLLTFWDRVFGTYVYREHLVPKEVGVIHSEEYPKPYQLIRSAIFPFTKKKLW